MKALTESEIQSQLPQIPNWSYQNGFLERQIQFSSFTKAIAFLNRVATLSEEQQHHPVLTNSYNHLLIQLNTHDLNGISEKDFTLAKAIDGIELTTG
jgi:4a-hydroxytetrahydrobiopterin dehydratase